MSTDGYRYEGTQYLKLGEESLANYNASIARMVVRYARGARDAMDFGAGIGTLALTVRSLGLEPLCVEPDDAQRSELQRRGFRTASSLDDVADESLDYVYSSNVLEHIPDDLGALVKLHGKLRPGGRLFLYVPAFQSLFSSLDVTVGHQRRYEAATLRARLQQADFAVDDTFYADFFGYFATLLFKRMGDTMSNANTFTLQLYDKVIFPVGRLIERLVRIPVGKNVVAVARRPQLSTAPDPLYGRHEQAAAARRETALP